MRNDILQQAQAIRADMTKVTATLTYEQALELTTLYPFWVTNTAYTVDTIIRYDGELYSCVQAHTSQADWTPPTVPALWVKIAAPSEYREIKDAMLPTEAFALGEIGWYKTEDNLYKSLIANNVYTPEAYPLGWEKVE